MGNKSTHIIIKWIWRSSTQLKHKVFFWLLFNNKLNTREMLKKNFILNSYDCEMCIQQKMESIGHLFFRCSFARRCWARIHIIFSRHISAHQAIVDIKAKLYIPFAMDIIILMTWAFWKQRNNSIFNVSDPSAHSCYSYFKQFFDLFLCRLIGKKHFASIEIWRASLL